MSQHNQFTLLHERRFLPYFLTQFLGAFNDNVYKNALIILITYQAGNLAASQTNLLTNLSAALFILPFFLFSATSGQLADKYEKSLIIRLIKILEILIMLLATVGFYFNNLYLLMAVLFLMGTHSTLFGPTKYGILPQHLKPEELIGGNGLVEMGTFLAILLGTLTGGILISLNGGATIVSLTTIAIAILGYLASRWIPFTPPVAPQLRINWDPFSETWRNLAALKGNRVLLVSIFGISWFWFIGGTYLTQLPNYTKLSLHGSEHVVTFLLTFFSLGIGIGSLLCERLSGRKVELGLVLFGMLGMTLFSLDLSLNSIHPVGDQLLGFDEFLQMPGSWRITMDIVLMSIFTGLYIVPLYTAIQQRSEPSHVSRIIASNNIINALLMVISALMAMFLLNTLGLTIPQLFLVVSLLNLLVMLSMVILVPEFLLRFLAWSYTRLFYRVQIAGLERLPANKAILCYPSPLNPWDTLLITSSLPRPVRFVIAEPLYHKPILHYLFTLTKTIPFTDHSDPEKYATLLPQLSGALEANELICICLPNSEETVWQGIMTLAKSYSAPVIPMTLVGTSGTSGPRRFWAEVELTMGTP